MTIEEVLAKDEKQIFDRKSIQIKPADLSDTICAFANADGGTVAIGISGFCQSILQTAIGLPDPMFNDNTFILKTTVMSAFFEGKSMGEASIGFKNALIRHNDASIRSGNASFHGKDRLIERLCQGKDDGEISAKNVADARAVIENVDVMQVITSKEVMRILSCQTTKARLVIKMLEKQGLIKAIQGKGKYILNVTGGTGEEYGI